MKTARQIFALLLAIAIVLSLSVITFADNAPTGKITITNAENTDITMSTRSSTLSTP